MTMAIDLRILELMSARLCHDLIGPVSAISNGAELLGDEDPDFAKDAIALVGDSARRANVRLQFYRFAYGFSGGGLAGQPPHQLVAEFFGETSVACDYGVDARALPLPQQKLACAMLAVAGEALPRGGRLTLTAGAAGPDIAASGAGSGPSPEIRAALAMTTSSADLTSRSVGGYFAGLLAEAQGCRITLADQPGGFRLTVVPR